MQNKFTFGIIGAMECEVNSLKSKLQNLEKLVVGKRIFYVGEKILAVLIKICAYKKFIPLGDNNYVNVLNEIAHIFLFQNI